jgi:hypothetical protein
MTRRTLLAAALAMTLQLVVACTRQAVPERVPVASGTVSSPGGGRLASPPDEHLQVTLRAGKTTPEGVLTFGDQRQDGVPGSVCWQQWTGLVGAGGCLDVSDAVYFPPQSIAVENGTVLYVFGDQTTATALLLRVTGAPGSSHSHIVQRLPLTEGASSIVAPPGDYTLEVDGSWPQGDGPLYFGLTVT